MSNRINILINAIIIMMNITFLSFVYYIYIIIIIIIYKRKNKETIIFYDIVA